MKNIIKLFLIVIIAAVLPRCQPVKVVGFSPGVEAKTMIAFKTFNFYKLQVSGSKGKYFVSNVELCKKAIASEMTSRGFKEVTDAGDLSINIGVLLESNSPSGSGEVIYLQEPNYTSLANPEGLDKATVGTITLELIDMKKNSVVWIGAVSGAVPAKEAAKQKQINKAITVLFEKFPVKVKAVKGK